MPSQLLFLAMAAGLTSPSAVMPTNQEIAQALNFDLGGAACLVSGNFNCPAYPHHMIVKMEKCVVADAANKLARNGNQATNAVECSYIVADQVSLTGPMKKLSYQNQQRTFYRFEPEPSCTKPEDQSSLSRAPTWVTGN